MSISKAVFILTIFSCLFYSNSDASIYPGNCVCEVKAQVLEVNETQANKDNYMEEGPTIVDMKIQIIKVEKMVKPGMSETMTCDVYAPGKIIEVHAARTTDFMDKNLLINPNSIIRAYIEYSGDENGQWYNFNHIEEVKE
ncbi:MAG: hypothetical protein WC417_04120 [Candidatus Omnitrophota bacterium]|jgi:hypothetical protein